MKVSLCIKCIQKSFEYWVPCALNAFKNPLNTGYPVQALSEPVNTISTTYNNIFSLSPNQQQDFEDVDFSTLTSPLGAKSEEKILECEINNI